jgi:hypothetical protein
MCNVRTELRNNPCKSLAISFCTSLLANADLYLALHESIIHFPRNLASPQAFKKEFVMLVSMVFDLERNALMIKKSMNLMDCRKDSAMNRHIDPDNCLNANSCLLSMRPTFYDPP